MKTINYPDVSEWKYLSKRPFKDNDDMEDTVRSIISDVKQNGDAALKRYTEEFDNVSLKKLRVSEKEISDAENNLDEELQAAIQLAKNNIETFHKTQLKEEPVVETMKGITCWQKQVPVEKVGLYIPGGTAPLFSTVLMLGVPAKLAGCKEIILCTPPQQNGNIHPAILFTARLVGIDRIYKAGGAQAIAAMAYGTEAIPNVYKIFGPGNAYVTKAKEIVQQEGIAIDLPAGPSELLIIADETSNPAFVAADLLSQAEHGADSQVVLLSNSKKIIEQVQTEIEKQIINLPRKNIAKKAFENSFAVVLNSLNECANFSNRYAPEHLIIATGNNKKLANKVTNAGSVFLGNYSCESAGDYASGTNHTLPTNGYAKSYSGVSVDSFTKKITFQELSAEGLQNIGSSVERMAEAEGLTGHKNAVTIRLNEPHPPEFLSNNSRDSFPLRRGNFADLEKLVRPHIKTLSPYSSARDEFKGDIGVFLNANENPFGDFNRYPDPFQSKLKRKIGNLKNIDNKNIFLGNGSDEIIDLLFRLFCNPASDKALIFEPTFGMYETLADVNNVELIKISMDENFQINLEDERLRRRLQSASTKIIFICSPNNPTGNITNAEAIEFILENAKGITVIDEAYIDFSSSESWISKIKEYPNLIVLQTLSKARAMAGLRIGMAFANSAIIQYLNKVKAPYNISDANQKLALERLRNEEKVQQQIETMLNERKRVAEGLTGCPAVEKVYPTEANFILVEVDHADLRYRQLIKRGIIVRNRDRQVKNCLRITIGKPEENNLLIGVFKNMTI